MIIHTDRIWARVGEDVLPRAGDITVDPGYELVGSDDAKGPLPIIDGLEPGDLAVFLSFIESADDYAHEPTDDEYATTTIGYLVTTPPTSPSKGDGILVAGDMIEAQPQTWLTPDLANTWNELADLGYTLEDFSLPVLAQYIADRRS